VGSFIFTLAVPIRPVILGSITCKAGGLAYRTWNKFLKRIVDFSDEIGRPIQLLYYPPYHSKYNPIERCWGILEQHWNGTLLQDIQTLLGWAQSMTWKGIHPKVWLKSKTYKKGISLSKQEMRDVEDRLERNPELPKWDILIQPANR